MTFLQQKGLDSVIIGSRVDFSLINIKCLVYNKYLTLYIYKGNNMKKENFEILPKLFKQNKCWKIDDLSSHLKYSVISVRIFLKKIGYYSSVSHNSKWYTLCQIPKFNASGLWFHKKIVFSKHGNLNQTISHFIDNSYNGLTAKEISKIITFPCFVVLNKMQKANQLYRIKTRKNFIYLSKDKSFKQKQINNIYSSEHSPLPSDIDGIKILVEIIKHPEYSFDELTEKLKTYGITCSSASIELFLQHHDIEKKL
jgi:hypothetical protein